MKRFTNLLLISTVLVGITSCKAMKGNVAGFMIHAKAGDGQGYKDAQEASEWSPVYDKHSGSAYIASCDIACNPLKYGAGDPQWQEDMDEWLDSDSDEPIPEDLKNYDGVGYSDSRDSAQEGWQ